MAVTENHEVPCPDLVSELWDKWPVQQGMGQSLEKRVTTGGHKTYDHTNTICLCSTHSTDACLSMTTFLQHGPNSFWSLKSKQRLCMCCPGGRGRSYKFPQADRPLYPGKKGSSPSARPESPLHLSLLEFLILLHLQCPRIFSQGSQERLKGL